MSRLPEGREKREGRRGSKEEEEEQGEVEREGEKCDRGGRREGKTSMVL